MAQIGVLQVRVEPDMQGFSSQVTSAMSGIGGALAGIATNVGRDLANIGRSVAIGAGAAITGLGVIGIKTAAGLETAELQFKVLLGSAEEAKQRVAELFEFARTTPFEADEVIKASRTMQIFGGDALATSENLKLVGDAAAGVGANFDEVAFWVSRSYALMQAGQPWGEAALRLQELGVLSGDARLEIEQLADAGASSADQWAVFTEDISRYNGAMDDLQNTFSGLVSTLKDTAQIGLAQIFQPAFESLKDFMLAIREFSDTAAFQAILRGLQAAFEPLAGLLDRAADGVAEFAQSLTVGNVLDTFQRLGGIAEQVAGGSREVYEAIKPLAPLFIGLGGAMSATYLSAIPLVGLIFPQISASTGLLAGAITTLVQSSDTARSAFGELGSTLMDIGRAVLPQLRGPLDTIVTAMGDGIGGAIKGVLPALETLGTETLPTLIDAAAELAGPLGEIIAHLGELAGGVIASVGPILADIASGVTAILAAGLSIVADLLGVLAANADLLVPALAGVAAAIGAIKFQSFTQQLLLIAPQIATIGDAMMTAQFTVGAAADGIRSRMSTMATGAMRSVGGLVGAITSLGIGAAVAGAVYFLTNRMREQKEEAEEAARTVQTYADRIREVGRQSAASEMVADLAEENEHLQTILDETGYSARQLADIIAMPVGPEKAAAWARFNSQLEDVLGNIKASGDYEGFGDVAGDADEAQRFLSYLNEQGLQPVTTGFENAAGAAEEFASEQEESKTISDAYRESIESLRLELERLQGNQANVADAQRNTADAMQALNDAFVQNGATLDESTQAGRDNADAMAQVRDSIWAQQEALAASGASTEEVTAKGNELRDTLINNVASALGITTQEAETYVNALGLTPESISTTAELSTTEAQQKLYDYLTNIGLTPEQINTLAWLDKNGATTELNEYINRLDLTPEQKNTLMALLDTDALADLANFNEEADVATRDRTVNISVRYNRAPGSGFMATEELAAGARGVPMMGPVASPMAADSLLRASTTTVTRPRLYASSMFSDIEAAGANVVVPVIEQRTYLGQTEVTDVVKSETVVIERDRSMKFLTGVG